MNSSNAHKNLTKAQKWYKGRKFSKTLRPLRKLFPIYGCDTNQNPSSR
jgi:hypothetical protein